MTVVTAVADIDPFDVRRARHSPGRLRPFNDAGVLVAADVHVALRLAVLADEDDESVVLAAALAVRAPRLGHVCVDLGTIAGSVIIDADLPIDLQALPWPDPGEWIGCLSASPLVAMDPAIARCAWSTACSTSTGTGARSAWWPPTW